MLSKKFDKLWSAEEKAKLIKIEEYQFKLSMALKCISIFLLMHLRLYKRPVGRPWIFDFGLLYFSAYSFLGSNIPGVFFTWDEYEDLAKKMA